MKRVLWTLLFGLLVVGSSFGQGNVPPFTLTAATQIGPTPPINLIGSGVANVVFTWNKTGTVSAGACALQGGVDGVTFGTTVIAAQTVTSTGAYLTVTAIPAAVNYLRINCTTAIVGSGGRVTFRVILLSPVSPQTIDTTGLATSANQTTANASLASIDSKIAAATDPCFGIVPASNVNAIVASTTLVKVVSAASSKKNNACGILVINDGASAAHFSLIEGTKSSTECDTGATAILGSTTAGNGIPVAPNQFGFAIRTTIPGSATNKDWCIQNDGTNSIKVYFGLVQQ